jgi:hypothetical protein
MVGITGAESREGFRSACDSEVRAAVVALAEWAERIIRKMTMRSDEATFLFLHSLGVR